MARPAVTVVLVHGWLADASRWAPVISQLREAGVPVVATANPLRGLTADAAYTAQRVREIDGPVLLAGHCYGGAVITQAAAAAPNTVGIVYVAGFALDIGESAGSIAGELYPVPGKASKESKELSIEPAQFGEFYAQDLPAEIGAVMGISQRPAAPACWEEPALAAAWRNLPSWYLVAADDRCLPPQAQRFMAARARSRVYETAGSHAVTLSQPTAVTDVLLTAARVLQTQ